MNLRFFKENLFDLVFPKFCLGCGQEGIWICPQCQDKIVKVSSQVCPECGRISELGRYCFRHCRKKALKGIITSCYYEEGPIKEIIHNFKYNNVLELGDFLGEIMAESLKENMKNSSRLGSNNIYASSLSRSRILITAVPLHWLRQAQRGFNQSEILAGIIAEKCHSELVEESVANATTGIRQRSFAHAQDDIPKIDVNFKILKKIRRTKPQVQTDSTRRRENLQNSFKFYNNIRIRGRRIMIIDDVATTGTTLNECARVLKKAGAKEVWGLVAARG